MVNMLAKRIIPCLDVDNGRVMKGVKFQGLTVVGDPVELAEIYNRQGADELVFLDIAASVEGRPTKLEWVKKVAEVVTIPFTVGGGIRNLDDMEALFDLGVNKVSINTAAVKNPELIRKAQDTFGKEKVCVAIDGRKNPEGKGLPCLEVLVYGGTQATGMDVVEWARRVEGLGAGSILLTSKDADGTKEGYDLEMTKAVAEVVSIPVIASGGAGKLEHLYDAVTKAGAAAVLCASVFHFGEISIKEAKKYLRDKGIPVHE